MYQYLIKPVAFSFGLMLIMGCQSGYSTFGVDKTGIGDFKEDTHLDEQVFMEASSENYSYFRVSNEENGEEATNGNGITGHNETSEQLSISWETMPNPEMNFGCMDDSVCESIDDFCGGNHIRIQLLLSTALINAGQVPAAK